MANTCLKCHIELDRTSLITISEKHYISSLQDVLDKIFDKEFIQNNAVNVSHECKGPKKAPPAPIGPDGNSKMFRFTSAPKQYKKCVVCNENTHIICSGCKDRKYYICSKECQKKDWKTHPETCTYKSKQI